MKLFLSTITKGSHHDTLITKLNSWCNLKKRKLHDLIFYAKLYPPKKSKAKGAKNQECGTQKVIIGRCKCCIAWEKNPALHGTAYVSFGAKRLTYIYAKNYLH
jgi:hypothetical protein